MAGPAPSRTERTEDGRYVVIDGRRWRATDPGIAEPEAAALRRWLASARAGVGVARRRGDDAAVKAARARVHAAKTALGERGPAWWEQSDAERRQRLHRGLDAAADEGFVPRPDPDRPS